MIPAFCWHICKTAVVNRQAKLLKRATKPTHPIRHEMTTKRTTEKEGRRHNII